MKNDQVSNVKLTSQAIKVLKLLGSFILNKQSFIKAEHRIKPIDNYSAKIIYQREN